MASNYALIEISSRQRSSFFPSNGKLSTYSIIKSASLIADVPPQIVTVSTSNSFSRVIMMLLRSVKTPNEKKEYPRNLSLNEVKSFYRNKLPVDLSALG